jgi:hypothetical protein
MPARSRGQNVVNLEVARVLHQRFFKLTRRKMLISPMLHFPFRVEIAVSGAKPWSFAPGVLRKRLVSQRRSANGACKSQGVLRRTQNRLGPFITCCAKFATGILRITLRSAEVF